MKTNFSQTQSDIFDLALDLYRGDFSRHIDETKVTKKDLENHLRDLINNDMLGGLTLYQAVRRNEIKMYEIVEELVNTAINEDVLNSPFIDAFVEVKNLAGNHWDTDRQLLDIGDVITLPKEWIYIHVYEDLERFLLGITTIDKMMDKVYKSINKYIQDRIYAQFNNVANSVPADFSASGNTEAGLGALVDKVQAAGGYTDITIELSYPASI